MIAFIDAHRDRFGVEPICRVLREHDCGIAPNTYWAAKKRPPSKRALRDEELVVEVHRVFEENLFVYGADKIWTQLNREEIRVARCTVERLMRAEGLSGARRGKAFTITTHADDRLHRPADLVARKFRAPAPDRLWVADLTYVKTHSGWVYVAFIIDVYSRMIVGWQASRSLRSDLAIDALEMAVWNRRRADHDLDQLVHHSDRGVQGGFNWSSQHLESEVVEDHVQASAGGGDSGDAREDVVARATIVVPARGPCRVLESDRSWRVDRRRRCRGGDVIRGRDQVVPRSWRDVTLSVANRVGPLFVVRRA